MEIKLTNRYQGVRKRLLLMIMRTFIFLLCTTVFSLNTDITNAQEKVKIDQDKLMTIDEVFDIIIDQTKYNFIYPANLFKGVPKVELRKGEISVGKLLQQTLPKGKFNVILGADNRITIKEKNRLQQKQITGKVTDEGGQPLVGVTVRVKGTQKGVATDFNGAYTIRVADADNVLMYSYIGFATQEIPVGNQTVIDVTLKESVSELDEVTINAGYYKTSKREATGNISRVTAKAIEKQPVSNPLAALQGRMAGVQITQTTGTPGGGYKIQIRGQNSIRDGRFGTINGNDPLVLIDGLPFSIESLSSSQVNGLHDAITGSSVLNSINPADIESIEILKDADATAIYGSRGANGVVLITTKKGKAGKTRFDVNMYTGMSSVTRKIELLSTEQYLESRHEGAANDGFDPIPSFFEPFFPDLFAWDQNRYTDWQEELIGGTAYSTDIQTSVSGGSKNTQFLLRGGYHKETTVFPGEFDYRKVSVHFNLNHVSSDNRFKLNFTTRYVADKNNMIGLDFTGTSLILAPNSPALYDDEGNLNWENSTWRNPLAQLEQKYLGKTNNLISNATLEYKIANNLIFKSNLGFNTIDLKESRIIPSTIHSPALGIGSDTSENRQNSTSRQSWIIEPQLDWNLTFGKGKLSLLVGATFQERTSDRFSQRGIGFSDNSLISNIGAASGIDITASRNTEYRYNAFYGRANYNWDGKYILNVTGRRDGSSRFGPGKQFANFAAIGAAWLFSEENFLQKNSFLSFGKLRGSYGTTGSDQIGDYQFLDSYSLVNGVNYEGITPLEPTQLFNNNFAWETNKKLELALDLGLFSDRIFLSAAYYQNRSSNQLVGIPLSVVTGFTSIQSNLPATVENKGIEFELNTTNFQKNDFIWQTNFNITIPKNKLVAFPNLEGSAAYKNFLVVGEPLNIEKLYQSTGVDPDTGLYTFTDFNNDDIINRDDRQVIQSLDPEYYGGLNNSFSYKGFEFDFMFQFVKQTGVRFLGLPGREFNFPRALFEDRWQEPGDIATTQRYTFGFNGDVPATASNYARSDAGYEDASFIRLKNVSISYQIPKKFTKRFSSRLYVQGQNLWTITNYGGLDPENQAVFRLPPLKTITLGAQFTF